MFCLTPSFSHCWASKKLKPHLFGIPTLSKLVSRRQGLGKRETIQSSSCYGNIGFHEKCLVYLSEDPFSSGGTYFVLPLPNFLYYIQDRFHILLPYIEMLDLYFP